MALDAAAQQAATDAAPLVVEAPGPAFLSSSFSASALILEKPLLDLVAAKDKKAAQASLALLRSHRSRAEEAERSLLSAWASWAEALSIAGPATRVAANPLSGYDRAAHAAGLTSLRSAEKAALAEAEGIIAKAAAAKNFSAGAIRLLGEFEGLLELPPSLLAGGTALAALKSEQLKSLLAAALSARPRLYVEALSLALPQNGRAKPLSAAEAFRAALFEAPQASPAGSAATPVESPASTAGSEASGAVADENQTKKEYDAHIASLKALLGAASDLGAEAGELARVLGLCYTASDAFGFLSALLLARPQEERAALLAGGIGPGRAYGVLDSAWSYMPWPKHVISEEHRRHVSLLYADWLSASLRNDGLEAGRFALLSVAPALDELLAARVAPAHKAALELSFERYWLEARTALSLDLRADTLLWLRSIGQRPGPDTLSLDVRITRWPKLPLAAGIDILLKAEGKSYALPYTAISASLQASLRSVFGAALPAFVYLEARGAASEGFAGPPEQSELALMALGEDLSERYPLGMAWSVEAWMEPYLSQSAHIRRLARYYAQTAQAARMASEPWYAGIAGQSRAGGER
jgi:hypothetical protein